MRTDTTTRNSSLTCGLEVFDFFDLEELSLAAGIVPTLRDKRRWRGGTLKESAWGVGLTRTEEMRGREKRQCTSGHEESARSYTMPPGDSTSKFWTHKTAYAVERLREPTVRPQAKWG